MEVVERLDVWLAALDPALGSELQKVRPCVVVSPGEANRQLRTVVIVPLTSANHPYPSRVSVDFGGRSGEAAIDQVRVLDKTRLLKLVGRLNDKDGVVVLARLQEFFEW